MKEEEIIWSGNPSYKPRLAILEIAGGEAGIIGVIIPLLFLLLLIFSSSTNSIWFSLLSKILLVGTVIVPEIHKHFRRSRTKYELTKESVRIYDFWYGQNIIHEISLKDIDRFAYVNFKDDCGRIHIIVNKELKIRTRNFWSGSFRSSIALEDLPNTWKVYSIFIKTLKEYKLNQ